MSLDIISESKKPFPFLGHIIVTLLVLAVFVFILYYTGNLKFFLNLFGYGADEYLVAVKKYCKYVDKNIIFKYSINSNDDESVVIIASPKDKYTLNNYGGPHIFTVNKKTKNVSKVT